MLKIIFVLVVVIAGVYIWLSPSSPASAPKASEGQNEKTSPPPTAVSGIKKAPPAQDSVFIPVPGSLAGKLADLAQKDEFKQLSIRTNFELLRRPAVNSPEVRKFLKKNASLLKECRDLADRSDLGVNLSGNMNQQIPYLSDFSTVCYLLCLSAEYQLKFGNKKEGCKELAYIVQLLKIFCSDAPLLQHVHTATRLDLRITNLIKQAKLPENSKKELLSQLPDRNIFSAMLQLALQGETRQMIYLSKWADAFEEEAKRRSPLSPDEQQWFNTAKELQKMPEERIRKVCEECNDILLKGFRENHLETSAFSNIGNKKENSMFFLLYYRDLTAGVLALSKRIPE